jgi:hypothetical protein
LKSLTIAEIVSLSSDFEYLRGEFEKKISGNRDGEVTLDELVRFLEHDDCSGIHLMKHLIETVKLKNKLMKPVQ